MSVEAVPAPVVPAAVDPAAPPALTVVPPVDPAAPPKPQEPTPAEEAEKRRASQQFAALAKKERGIVSMQQAAKQELAAERARIEAEKAELAEFRARYQAAEDAKAKAKIDPDGYLRGVFGENWYETLTEWKLNGGKPTPDLVAQSVDEKIAAFRAEQEAERKAEAEKRAKATEAQRAAIVTEQERTIAEFRENLTADIKAKGDEYELVNLYGEHDTVFDVIDEFYRVHGKILSNSEAAALVEKHLEEGVAKATESKKWKARSQPKPPEPPAAAGASPTLSNGLSSAPGFTGEPKNEQDRIARALAAMEAAAAKR